MKENQIIEQIRSLTPEQIDYMTADIKYTDADNGAYFAQEHAHDVRFVVETGKWIVFDGKRWIIDSSGKIALLQGERTMRQRYGEEANAPVLDKDNVKKALTTMGRTRIENALALAAGRMAISYYALNTAPWLLNVKNGTVNLRTGEMKRHDPADFITHVVPFEFKPEARCPRFVRFLREILPDVDLRYIQRWFGYAATGEDQEKKFQVWKGELGNNGKSTLKNVVLHVLGDYAIEVNVNVFIGKTRDYKGDDLVGLRHKRIVFAAEPDDGVVLNAARIKSITGMDKIRCRPLKSNEWIEYEPAYKPVILTNHELGVYDTTDAFWGRMDLIQFDQVFRGRTDDKSLKNILKAEAEGILSWIIEGAIEWYAHGLNTVKTVTDETSAYRQRQDSFGQFLNWYEKSNEAPKVRWPVLSSFLRTLYTSWTVREGREALGQRRFTEEMERRGYSRTHKEDGAKWERLTTDDC